MIEQSLERQSLETLSSSIMKRVRSLGDNCEVGLLQRKFGLEPHDLFRFSDTSHTDRLIAALEDRLANFGSPDDLVFNDVGGEWISISRSYGLVFHSSVLARSPRLL